MDTLLSDFAQDYSEFSDADNLYFIFGDTSSVKVSGCKKIEDGEISIKDNLETNLLTLPITKGDCDTLTSGMITSIPSDNILVLVENNIKYLFTLKEGTNFYFMISKEIDGEKHAYTNG